MHRTEVYEFVSANFHNKTDKELAELLNQQGHKISSEGVRHIRRARGLRKVDGIHAPATPATPSTSNEALSRVAQLLKNSGIDPEDIGKVERVRLNEWQGMYKDEEGEAHVIDMQGASIILNPKWETGPEWPVVQPVTPVVIEPTTIIKGHGSSWKTAVILPDPQIGYRRLGEKLDPFHCERAMDIALQVIQDIQPDLIINIGDMLDFAEFSRFTLEPAFALTTQATIDRAHRFLAQQKANAPQARIVMMEGNHDRRLSMRIVENAKAAFGLRRADQPEGWPVLSVENLLALDTLGVEYVSGYPAASYYINERLKVMHGAKTGKRGTVANRIVDDERVSTIVGHTHHINQTYKTVDTLHGARTSFAATLGCLCRIDGAVPSTKGSTDTFGRPVKRYEDWQQAVGVVTYIEGDGPFSLEHAYIHEGLAIFRGKPYFAEETSQLVLPVS